MRDSKDDRPANKQASKRVAIRLSMSAEDFDHHNTKYNQSKDEVKYNK